MTEYQYDEIGYEGRLQKLLQRANKLTSKQEKVSKEKLIDGSKIDNLQKEFKLLRRQLEDLINELEVEDFLTEGPKGKDPI